MPTRFLSPTTSRTHFRLLAFAALAALPLSHSAWADVTKADNTNALNDPNSYLGGATPTINDLLNIDATVTVARTAPLGGDLSIKGIFLTNPGGTFIIGNTPATRLTIGASGIDMTNATASLTISNAIVLGASQTWNVAAGQTLTTNNGPITGAGALTLGGAGGTVVLNNNLALAATGNSGESTITLTGGAASLAQGQTVTGTGIGTNAVVQSINGSTVTLSAPNTAAVSGNATFAGNTYSGGTVLNAGLIQLGSGAPSVVTATAGSGTTITAGAVNAGVFGTGNLTINNGVTIASGSQQNSIAHPLINIAGNFTLGTATLISRMAFNGTFDMGGQTRIVTLNKTSNSVASGNEILSIGSRANTGFAPVFQNGTIDFEAGPLATAAAPATAIEVVAANFVNNAGLIVGPNVIFVNNSSFGTGTNAPTLTVNGTFYSGSGTTTRQTSVASLFGTNATALFTNPSNNTTVSTATLTISGTSGTTSFAGSINDGASQTLVGVTPAATGIVGIAKTGGSTQILTGTNTYTGPTLVSGGALLINGANTGVGATGVGATVNSGGMLGGSGSIASTVTVNAGGILQGGTGIVGTTFSLSNNLTVNSNAGATGIIQLALGAGGAHSTLARTGGTWVFAAGQQVTFTGTPTPGLYDNIIMNLGATDPGVASFVNTNGYTGTFIFDGNNVDFNLTAVPEPSTWAMMAGGLGLLVGFQRLRRRTS